METLHQRPNEQQQPNRSAGRGRHSRRSLRLLAWILSGICLITVADASQGYKAAREKMVADAVLGGGVTHAGVLSAMQATERHFFVRPDARKKAYFDMALPIGYGQTISPPYIVAFMTAQLDPQPGDKVLEIGTGSGYQAAVLSPLVRSVYTIEIVPQLGQSAASRLKRLNYKNVKAKIGDGYQGWAEYAPFDKIIVTCSPENVPQPLIDQLADNGLMVIPIGERFRQTLVRFRKRGKKLIPEPLQATFFVPMTGKAEDRRQKFPDPSNPKLANGGFEQAGTTTDTPDAWYYLRQVTMIEERTAPEGSRVAFFENQTAGRPATALQAFGADGGKIKELEIRFQMRGQNIQPSGVPGTQTGVVLEFYGPTRAPVGDYQFGPWRGTFDWKHVRERVEVPRAARLAVIGFGLFGDTGRLWLDDIQLKGISRSSE